MSELKPCPFCGGHVDRATRKPAGMDVDFVINCQGCCLKFSPFCATEEDCERLWNLRPVLAQEAGPVVERQDSKNQCDGCMAGKPLENGNRHRMGSGAYPDFMSCTARLYTSPPAPVAPEEPIAYMRNEGKPNNLVKCTFACPGAFGVYAHSSKDTDRLDWIERHDPDIRSDIDTDMEQNHWPTS